MSTDTGHNLACDCRVQQPERQVHGCLSLLVCRACGRLVLELRKPDRLAVLEQDLAALAVLARELQNQREASPSRSPRRSRRLRLVTPPPEDP